MYINLPNFIVLIFVFIVFLIVRQHLAITRQALATAKSTCEKNALQFLDQSIVFSGFTRIKNTASRIIIARRYTFEFSTHGDKRYKGLIVMTKETLYNIELETYKDPSV